MGIQDKVVLDQKLSIELLSNLTMKIITQTFVYMEKRDITQVEKKYRTSRKKFKHQYVLIGHVP